MKIVLVGGCGHVGLPLGVSLSVAGMEVVSYDINKEVVNMVNEGVTPFLETSLQEFLEKARLNKFYATSDASVIDGAEIIIMIVGTPLDTNLNPVPDTVVNAVEIIMNHLQDGQLLILRSTVYPGSTSQVESLLKSKNKKVDVVFCPERIAEGYAIDELHTLPQIIGSRGEEEYFRAAEVFKVLGIKTLRTNPEEAELAKLFTNAWRYIKFAAANEFWQISNNLGIEYENVRGAIRYDYPRANDLPSAGFAAGPCLFKDTKQLLASSDNQFLMGSSAIEINENLPKYLIARLKEKFDLQKMTIGIIGMAFKAESDDTRSSLSFALYDLLKNECKEVLISDPYVSSNEDLISLDLLCEASDLVIIGAPHKVFSNLKFDQPVIDIWNLIGNGSKI